MLSSDLFQQSLIAPATNCNKLYIVSGYATSAMAFHHINQLSQLGRNDIQIRLIVGMAQADGISESNHSGFKHLMQQYVDRFECSYIYEPPPVHSKIYIWLNNNAPVKAFIGSANYTQHAFISNRQKEILSECDSQRAVNYYNALIDDTIYCTHPDSEEFITIYNSTINRRRQRLVTPPARLTTFTAAGLESITFSLLARDGSLPQRSGLNWGQRPDYRREPNQAYIKLPSTVYNSDFFPSRGVHFTVNTDDDHVLICTRAQDNGKAIHTPHNNSLIGEYFRNRLGVGNGRPVLLSHLQNYGRSDLTFYKIDEETFYMDFSVI